MKTPLDGFLRAPAAMFELGLHGMDTGVRLAQFGLTALTGRQRRHREVAPPLDGPPNLDAAVTEFANRLVMIARWTPRDEMPTAAAQIVEAARQSFRNIDWSSPRSLMLPLEAALSAGTLLTQQTLRFLATYEVTGVKRFPRFVANVMEMFAELQVFVGVYYDRLIARYRERLKRVPSDAATRTELGRVLIKLGLYEQALAELTEAARDPGSRALALHEAAVAYYRAGKCREAALTASRAMEEDPANERVRAWGWLAAQSLGGYPEEVPARHRMEMRVGYAQPSVEFEDIAPQIGLDKTSAGRGLCVFDYDNDGLLDVVITAAHAGCSLYHNNGDGTFSDVSIASGLDNCVNGFIVAAADYDNDGNTDLFVTRIGFYYGDTTLFRNNGDGTFTDVTRQAGLAHWGPSFTATWADYNNDGYVDLFVANNLGGLFDRKSPNLLFRNNGDGTFTEVAAQAGLVTPWPTIGAAWGDYDNDGYPDLFVSNGLGRSQLCRNNGDGTFTDVSRHAGIDSYAIGSTCFWCDIDNDGWLDLVQFSWSDHEDVIHTMRHGHGPADGRPMRVWRNNRDGSFTNISPELGIDGCWGTMSGNCGDFNNDGWLDFVLGNGSPRMDRLEPLVLLERNGTGRYSNITFSAGLPFTGKGHGANMADLFGDGRLSVMVAAGGAYPGDLLTTGVFRPKKLPGNYLNVRLVGVKSNRSALGARVTLEAGGRRQVREVSGGSNFGCTPFEQHFGLGTLAKVDALEIRWPTSGLVQRFIDLPANRTLRFVEGQAAWEDVYSGMRR